MHATGPKLSEALTAAPLPWPSATRALVLAAALLAPLPAAAGRAGASRRDAAFAIVPAQTNLRSGQAAGMARAEALVEAKGPGRGGLELADLVDAGQTARNAGEAADRADGLEAARNAGEAADRSDGLQTARNAGEAADRSKAASTARGASEAADAPGPNLGDAAKASVETWKNLLDGATGGFLAADPASEAAPAHPVRSEADGAALSLLDAELAPGVLTAAAPVSFSLQRQEYGLWSHFLMHYADGAPAGFVERRHWRQPWRRRYDTYDAAGRSVASATSPWVSFGNLFSWHASLYLKDGEGHRIGTISGRLFTLLAASYRLRNGDGTVVAEASIDDRGQGAVFYAPGSKRVVATLMRDQAATRGCDRWLVRIEDARLLPEQAWPLIVAFFADNWTKLARTSRDG